MTVMKAIAAALLLAAGVASSADIRSVVNSTEFADRVRHLGISPSGNTPQELEAWMHREMRRWAEIATAANIKADER